MDSTTIYAAATWIIPLIFAIVLHEISHGWVAYAFGDTTAKDLGRLSPNPIRHVDPIGTIVLPMVLALSGAPILGWAKPVPVRFDKLRKPRGQMVLVALAGPGMNFLLALLSALALALMTHPGDPSFLAANLRHFMAINVFLGVFNLIPLPPFDGGHVVEGLLPEPLARQYRRLRPIGFPLILFLIVILPLLAPNANIVARIVMPPFRAIMNLFFGIAG